MPRIFGRIHGGDAGRGQGRGNDRRYGELRAHLYFRQQSRHQPPAHADFPAESEGPGRQDYRGESPARSQPDASDESEPAGLLESAEAAYRAAGPRAGAGGFVSSGASQWRCRRHQGHPEGTIRAGAGRTAVGD